MFGNIRLPRVTLSLFSYGISLQIRAFLREGSPIRVACLRESYTLCRVSLNPTYVDLSRWFIARATTRVFAMYTLIVQLYIL
jgi:hypothetical protein